MTDMILRGVMQARANWGRWVVDCPRCPSAMQMEPGDPLFRCADCGAQAPVLWPANPAAIERLLMMRPDPTTRNWEPGEDLTDLLVENIQHGLFTDPALPDGLLISIVGDEIVADALPASPRRGRIGG